MTCCVHCKVTEAACELRRCCDACQHDEPTTHRVITYADSTGWRATCSCGWRISRRDRDDRDRDVDQHGQGGPNR